MLNVTLLTANKVIFEGKASKAIFPGEKGVFEIGFFHRPIVSRLLPGLTTIDDQDFLIRHGIVKVKNSRVIAMVELDVKSSSPDIRR